MVSKRNFQNGRPMLQQRSGLRDAVLPYKKGPPFKQQQQLQCGPQSGSYNNFQQMMFNGSQIPDNPGYMDFNNPTPPINGMQNGRPVFAQQQNKKKNNKGKLNKNKQQQQQQQQQQSPSQQNQRTQQQQNHQNHQQQQKQQQNQQQQQNNGNWSNNNNNNNNNRNIHQMGGGYMSPQNRFNGNMQRGGGFNPMHSGGCGPINRGRRFLGPPGIGPPPPHGMGPMSLLQLPPHGFQPPMIPPMTPMGGRGPMPPPPTMGGRGPMPPMGMQPPPPPFLRRNGRGGPMPMHPLPPPIPPMIGPQRMQRVSLPPPLFNGGIGKIKKPNSKLVQQKIVKNRSSVKTLKTLVNQYPIDKPWITDEIRAEHDKKLDLEKRLKGHKDDELFAQFKTQRDTFVSLYEKAREEYLKQEAAAVKAKDANDKETLSKKAAAKNGNNKEAIPMQANDAAVPNNAQVKA